MCSKHDSKEACRLERRKLLELDLRSNSFSESEIQDTLETFDLYQNALDEVEPVISTHPEIKNRETVLKALLNGSATPLQQKAWAIYAEELDRKLKESTPLDLLSSLLGGQNVQVISPLEERSSRDFDSASKAFNDLFRPAGSNRVKKETLH